MQRSQQKKINHVAVLNVVNKYFFMNDKVEPGEKLTNYLRRHKRFGIIVIAIIALNLAYGFDARFTIINFLWIIISVTKIK